MLHLVASEIQRNAELISIQFKPRSRYGAPSKSIQLAVVAAGGYEHGFGANLTLHTCNCECIDTRVEGDRVKAGGFFGAARKVDSTRLRP